MFWTEDKVRGRVKERHDFAVSQNKIAKFGFQEFIFKYKFLKFDKNNPFNKK